MNLTDLVEGGTKELGVRFSLIGLLPSTILFLFLAALYCSGAPDNAPNLHQVYERVKELGTQDSILLVLAVLTFSLVVHPLQHWLVQMLEGYWGDGFPFGLFTRLGKKWHSRRRLELVKQNRVNDPTNLEQVELAARAGAKLRSSYPDQKRILPTMLGNVMRAAEDSSDEKYGLDAIVLWPRLYALLPDKMVDILSDQRNQLDLAARFCATFLLATAISIIFLYRQGWWLLVPAITLLLAWLSYRAAIAAALAYGTGIQTAFDLYRFELIKALQLELPADRKTEKESNQKLSKFLRQGESFNLQYQHSSEAKAKPSQPE